MAEYLILIFGDEAKYAEAGEEEWARVHEAHTAFFEKHSQAIRGGNALQPTTTGTTIRGRDNGGFSVTDGPFVETKEALGGYYLIEAGDLDEAIAIAKDVPAQFGGVEVRPVLELG
jgi:hypothetical protein